MKKLFVLLSLLLVVMVVNAIPAKPGLWQTIRLLDGTEVSVEKVGDEHLSWLRDAEGNCYIRQNDGYVLADKSILLEKYQARVNAKRAKRRAIYASTSDGLGKYGQMSMGSVPSIGQFTIPVVMVQFSDMSFKSTTTVEKMRRYYNEEGYHDETGCVGSVRDYFKAQSGGMFVPTFDVIGIVTLSKSYQYYGQNDSDGNDMHLDDLPGDVTAAAVSQLGADFSKYVVAAADKNHTAGVPLLCMLYAGKGEATESETTANGKLLWPCEWDDVEDSAQGNYQGVHFNSFFIGNELASGGSALMGMGVFCHEFGHALGLPDFYVTDYSYSGDDAFGNWSIMDTGAYVDDYSRLPMGYNAYEKSYMGWLDLKEIPDSATITLGSPLGTAEHSAYIIRNSSNESFIFENRQPGTWYPSEYGSGILVTRIAYSYNQWAYNTLNNTQSKKRACVLTADGSKLYYSASKSNLYGNSKTSIASLKTLSGTSKTIGITDITKKNDGTVTFLRSGGQVTPTPQPDGVIFYESFNQCDGKGGNDGSWSGNGVAIKEFLPDNDGWNAPNAYGASACAKFGKSGIMGYATTPSISLNGTAELTFRAGAWDSSKDGSQLEVTVEGGTVTPSYFSLKKGEFTTYTATVQGSGIVLLTFSPNKGRFFLDEVLLKGINTGVDEIRVPSKFKGLVYTLDGRYVGKSLDGLGRGLYIVDGKKKVVR